MAALSACGGEDAKLLPGETAREITANLDSVKQLSDEGDCVGAESAAAQVGEQIEALGGVDRKLKEALDNGAERLNEVVDECEEAEEPETVAPAEVSADPKKPKHRRSRGKKAEKEEEKAEKEREKEERAEEKEAPPGRRAGKRRRTTGAGKTSAGTGKEGRSPFGWGRIRRARSKANRAKSDGGRAPIRAL